MKRFILLLVAAILICAGIVWARQTDYKCVSDCTKAGYQYSYCVAKCSW
jgi:hypothetical protein